MRSTVTWLLLLVLVACNREPAGIEFVPFQWDTSTPAEASMDNRILDSAFVLSGDKGFVDALLVIRHGKIVREDYYNGFSAGIPHNIMSVSKSILSAITGIAIEGNYGLDLDDRVLDYFPEYDHPGLDERKHDITVQHLLTMRMGIENESAMEYGYYMELYNSENWIRATLEEPLINAPGEKMNYNTFITHLLSGIITKVTGTSIKNFADELLFRPLGIDVDLWERDPQGIYFGGNSMHITPREMAAFGYLYLMGGKLNGEQIVPVSWIEKTLSPSTDADHPNSWGDWKNYNYAWLWWLGEFNGQSSFMGYGYGGQFIIVFPGLDLIVVSTCENNILPEATTEQEWFIFEMISRYILPSLKN